MQRFKRETGWRLDQFGNAAGAICNLGDAEFVGSNRSTVACINYEIS